MKQMFTALALLALAGGAKAADLPQAAPYTPAPVVVPSPLYNWAGFYIGAMGGGGWTNGQGANLKGGFGGGTVGGNAQFSNFVIGAELEGAWSGLQASAAFGPAGATDNFQAFGSATARAGVAINNVLVYGKGGFALASNKVTVSVFGLSVSDTQTHPGYTVGAGLEYGVTPNWSAKVEYLWAHYQSENYFAGLLPPGVASGTFEVQTVKVGVNYRFGWGGPVVARY